MSVYDGIVIAVCAAAVTFIGVALVGLALVGLRIQDERRGTGCRGDGCRRSRPGQGREPRVAEITRGDFLERSE